MKQIFSLQLLTFTVYKLKLWLSHLVLLSHLSSKVTHFSFTIGIGLKEPAPILLDFFQSFCDFGTIRNYIFLIIILKFHALLDIWKETSKICLFYWLSSIVELQLQFIFSSVFGQLSSSPRITSLDAHGTSLFWWLLQQSPQKRYNKNHWCSWISK